MPTGEDALSSAVDRQLAVLKKSLLEECEKLSAGREQVLKDENAQLRKELAVFKQHEAKEQPEAPPEENSPDLGPDASVIGELKASPELTAVAQLGDLNLGGEFWSKNAARPGHDQGLITDIEDQDADQFIQSSHLWIINPTGNLKLSWDVIGIPILAWDLITIPMQVFGIEDADPMVFMGWVTLIFWTLDVPVCFLTGYFDKEGELVMEWGRIVGQYFRGMFGLDMLIIGSDWVSIILEAAGNGAPSFLSNMAILRALRITRFARLMRLRKLKAKWQTVEDHIESEWCLVSLGLVTKILNVVAITHYVGCVFFFIGAQHYVGYDTWLDTPYFQHKRSGTVQGTLNDAPWEYQYWTTLHWAITQFTPGGMHVQPQNIPERAFTIFCLLFGMVVFSSFIASVTQARMQLNKMMSKFERDLWLLRKFCRQNKISMQLTIRMRRYVDLVLIPQYHHMSQKDVIILPQLSIHLREELRTELESQKLIIHPFFQELEKNKAAMAKICNTALGNISVARGDVVFGAAEKAKFMYIVTSGQLDYIPHSKSHKQETLEKGRFLCEAALWTSWVTQGQLQGDTEATAVHVDGTKFRTTLASNAMHMQYARRYAKGFLDRLNAAWQSQGLPSDLQESFATDANAEAHAAMKGKGSAVPPASQVFGGKTTTALQVAVVPGQSSERESPRVVGQETPVRVQGSPQTMNNDSPTGASADACLNEGLSPTGGFVMRNTVMGAIEEHEAGEAEGMRREKNQRAI